MSGQDKNMKGIGQPLKTSAEKIKKSPIMSPGQSGKTATEQAQTKA